MVAGLPKRSGAPSTPLPAPHGEIGGSRIASMPACAPRGGLSLRITHLLSAALAMALLIGSAQTALGAALTPPSTRVQATIDAVDADTACVDDDGAVGDEATVDETAGDAATETAAAPELTVDPIMDDEEPASDDDATAADGTTDGATDCTEDAVPAFDVAVACGELAAHPSLRVLCSLYRGGWSAGAAAAIERVIASHATKVAPGWTKKHTVEQATLRTTRSAQREAARAERAATRSERAAAKDAQRAERDAHRQAKPGARAEKAGTKADAREERAVTKAGAREERAVTKAAAPSSKPSAADTSAAKGKRS